MIVLPVDHQERMLQLVIVMPDSSITITLVSLVLITVPLVTTETNVLPVNQEDKEKNVNVQNNTMMPVKLNVLNVTEFVMVVMNKTDVPPVNLT